MSSPLIAIDYKESLANMLKKMHDKKLRRLAVTQNGKVIGIVTEKRILESLA